MFTGIIETIGHIQHIEEQKGNRVFTVQSEISSALKIDQSVSHNGVCLTVIDVNNNTHKVEAIEETLEKSNLGQLEAGDLINLERSMAMSARLDGHIVQGHVDTTARCAKVEVMDGSWMYTFAYPPGYAHLIVPKGSISVNGVSLTVVDPASGIFKVAIIPFTFTHTNFKTIRTGDLVNIEFDILGKYVHQAMSAYQSRLEEMLKKTGDQTV